MLLHDSMIHANQARKLMAVGGEASLRYAALEIRMAIELLFYKLIPSYRDELPDEVLKQWQPKKIIDALIDCDPYVEQNSSLTMAVELPNGGHGPAIRVGSYKAVNRKLLRRYYHKIGSYLHAAMVEGHRDLTKMQSFLDAAATRVEEYCRETTVISNFGKFHTLNCVCGRKIKRNDQAVQLKPYVRCPNEQCQAVHDLIKNDEDGTEWKLRESEFVCPECKTSNYFGSHLIDTGKIITCVECSQKYIFRTGIFVSRVEEPAK
jgi:DNA-directed RNA polymerase subunit RPC12/RpoP